MGFSSPQVTKFFPNHKAKGNGEISKSAKILFLKSIFNVKNYPNLFQLYFHLRISI